MLTTQHRRRGGGGAGAPTTITQDDGTAMNGKGKQFVAHGRTVVMAFPGGAGYGDPGERPAELREKGLGTRLYFRRNCRKRLWPQRR